MYAQEYVQIITNVSRNQCWSLFGVFVDNINDCQTKITELQIVTKPSSEVGDMIDCTQIFFKFVLHE